MLQILAFVFFSFFLFDRDRMILLKMEQEIIDFISDNK